jgi:multidrug efflux pump subunit AcrA (membrane-fusion protein)
MFAGLDLTLQVRDDAVVIPEAAVILNGEMSLVVVVEPDKAGVPTAQFRPVKVGMHMAGQVEITDGLKGGEKVVVEGHQKTRPGGPVKLAGADAAQPKVAKQ